MSNPHRENLGGAEAQASALKEEESTMSMPREERKALAEKVRYKHFKLSWLSDKVKAKGMDDIARAKAYATFAYAPIGAEGDVYYAFTFCAPEDQFCRKTGRNIALRRLFDALQKKESGPWGQVYIASPEGPWPAKTFPSTLRNWLRGAREMGICTPRWYYELPGTEPACLKIDPLERKR